MYVVIGLVVLLTGIVMLTAVIGFITGKNAGRRSQSPASDEVSQPQPTKVTLNLQTAPRIQVRRPLHPTAPPQSPGVIDSNVYDRLTIYDDVAAPKHGVPPQVTENVEYANTPV